MITAGTMMPPIADIGATRERPEAALDIARASLRIIANREVDPALYATQAASALARVWPRDRTQSRKSRTWKLAG